MEKKRSSVASLVIAIVIGIISTLVTLKQCGLLDEKIIETEKTVTNVNITETNSMKEPINKVYKAVVYVESYQNNKAIGSGSGFIYKVDDKYGYVLTNEHVISTATSVKTTNIEGKESEAKVLGKDSYSDIAVLQIAKEDVLLVSELGKSKDMELGDTIFTVGSPLGKTYMGSVTKGIISGKDRTVESSQYIMEVLQVDAALNPGNSGGPLCNMNGEVIGINSMKLVQSEIEGMGFAIPIELALTIAEKLEKGESVDRPYLGISMSEVTNTYQLFTKYGIMLDSEVTEGVVVVEVAKNSPAEKGGLKSGDVILYLNEKKVSNVAYLRSELYKYNIGDVVEFKVYREKQIKSLKIKLDKVLEENS